MVSIQQESLHTEFVKLLKNVYNSIKFDNANFIKVSELAKEFETKLLKLSEERMIQVNINENLQ